MTEPAPIGHNSKHMTEDEKEEKRTADQRLRSYIKRIEKLEEDKSNVTEDIKDVYSEAKSTGFNVKIIRQIVRERKMDVKKRREQAELLDLYKSAIGMEV